MGNQHNNNFKTTLKYPQGSGSEYHRLHASNVPDYGANNIDPNAESIMKKTDHPDQQ